MTEVIRGRVLHDKCLADAVNRISDSASLKAEQVRAIAELLYDGCTVPFITRYRKERTGGLGENEIRVVKKGLEDEAEVVAKREKIIAQLQAKGVLDPHISRLLASAATLDELECLYEPFKPSAPQSRGAIARAAGAGVYGDKMLAGTLTQEEWNSRKGVTKELVLDAMADAVAHDQEVRKLARNHFRRHGVLSSRVRKGADADGHKLFKSYEDFQVPVGRARGHQIMALNRGEARKVLSVKVDTHVDGLKNEIQNRVYCVDGGAAGVPGAATRESRGIAGLNVQDAGGSRRAVIGAAIADALKRLVVPSIVRQVRSELTKAAHAEACAQFRLNMCGRLTTFSKEGENHDVVVLGVDPAFRTGCKLAVIDTRGEVVETGVIFPHPPQARVPEAEQTVRRMVRDHGVQIISLGNGTGCRETEAFLRGLFGPGGGGGGGGGDADRKRKRDDAAGGAPPRLMVVNEAGASVYSTSEVAQADLPALDPGARSAVSIARRAVNPLSELLKIDPMSIGAGQYQHDLKPADLKEEVDQAVSTVVHAVGVDINTSSAHLLRRVSGLNERLADRIVAHRREHKRIGSRQELLKIAGIGSKTFEQCAGFIRVYNGPEFLDATNVHPDCYPLAYKILGKGPGAAMSIQAILDAVASLQASERLAAVVGEPASVVQDILQQLGAAGPRCPGREGREDVAFSEGVRSLADVKPGLVVSGCVQNVTTFGAFVDIGVGVDGMVHVSEMRNEARVQQTLTVGQTVKVRVVKVETIGGPPQKGGHKGAGTKVRIGLSMNCAAPPGGAAGGASGGAVPSPAAGPNKKPKK